MTPDVPQPLATHGTPKTSTGPNRTLLVILDRDDDRNGVVHVVPHPPVLSDQRWDTRVPATVTTLCGITSPANQVIILAQPSTAPCERCVLISMLDTLHHTVHHNELSNPTSIGGLLRGYLVDRSLADSALALLTDRGTPAPALVDDRTPDALLILTVNPYDGPLPWPDSIHVVTEVPALPPTAPSAGTVRWHHLPDATRLAGDLELCAALIKARRMDHR